MLRSGGAEQPDGVGCLRRLEDLDADLDAKIGAIHGLRSLGREAVPALLGLLRDPDPLVRYEAAEGFLRIDPVGETFTAPFARLVHDQSIAVRCLAITTLGWRRAAGREGATALRACLEDPHEWIRAHAACSLADLGDGSSRVREVLHEGRESDDDRIRERCFDALGLLRDAGGDTTTALLKALDDPKPRVVAEAALALGRLGQAGAAAIPKLIEFLGHEEPGVRRGAVQGLHFFGPLAAPAAPALLRLLDADPSEFDSIAMALATIGEAGRPAIPRLVMRLSAENRYPVWPTVDALARFAAVAPEARAALVELTRHPDGQARSIAACALADLGTAPGQWTPLLIGLLQDTESLVRYNAARMLVDTPENADAAVAVLEGLLGDPDPFFRAAAASVLTHKDRGSPRVVRVLIEALTGNERLVRSMVIPCLAKLARKFPDAKAALLRLLGRDGGEPGPEVSLALVEAGEVRPETVRGVIAALRSVRPHERVQAAWVLCQLKKPLPDAVDALKEALSDADSHVRVQAAYTLARWGQAPPEAKAILDEGLHDSDPWVRKVASDGLALLRGSVLWAVPHALAAGAVHGSKRLWELVARRLRGR